MNFLSDLLHEKELIKTKLNKLVFGSIEIRKNKDKKYIYVHKREDGLLKSKYVGEYSDALYKNIQDNNLLGKQFKKQLKDILKQLDQFHYSAYEITNSIQNNVDLARRSMVDLIYKQAKLEGVATTYSDTETIVNGGIVNNMSVIDITKVVNLKHAWEFILSNGVICYPTNYNLLCQINGLVQEGLSYSAGKIRSFPVTISGTNYIPPIPFESVVKEELESILNSRKDNLNKTIDLLLYVMKKQIFSDGNKRTSVIFANHYLINKGLGLIVIPDKLINEFKKLLIDFYENRNQKIKKFLIDKCLIKIK